MAQCAFAAPDRKYAYIESDRKSVLPPAFFPLLDSADGLFFCSRAFHENHRIETATHFGASPRLASSQTTENDRSGLSRKPPTMKAYMFDNQPVRLGDEVES